MAMGGKNGKMAHFMKVILERDANMVKENISGLTVVCMKEYGLITILKGMVNITGLMVELMKDLGKKINFMERVFIPGETVDNMMVFMLKIKNKVLGHTYGLMVGNMKDFGTMENNTVKVNLLIVKVNQNQVYGKMVNVLNGFKQKEIEVKTLL